METYFNIRKKLNNFTLDVHYQGDHKRIGILGASGCGKSMTLKAIAGIADPDEGEIRIGDRELYNSARKINVKPRLRKIGYLFQNYALFPTMTVEENIAAGLKGSKEENQARVDEMVARFRLTGLEKQLPRALSGGQQQRVALARLMAYEPDMILLDEPFSAMDSHLKDMLQQQVNEMLQDYSGTVILVSHNRDEIYRFCEHLLIMDQGEILTEGPTKEIFKNPKHKQTAILTGCKNYCDIRRIDAHTCELIDWGLTLHLKGEIPEDAACIGYRAHYFVPIWSSEHDTLPENCFKIEIESTASLPFELNYYLKPQGDPQPDNPRQICWFAQQHMWRELREKGLPDYLGLAENRIHFLRK